MNDTDLTRWLDVELRRLADPTAPDRDARRERLQRALRSSDPAGYEPADLWAASMNLVAYWLSEAAAEVASQTCGVNLDLTESIDAANAAERIVQAQRGPLVDAIAAAHSIPRDHVREYVWSTWSSSDSTFVTSQVMKLALFEVGRHFRTEVAELRDQAAAQGALV